MSSQPVHRSPGPDEGRLSLLQRLTFLFRSYELPADCVPLTRPFQRDDRRCHTTALPPEWPSDETGRSEVRLFEDGLPLGPAHVSHDDIRTLGKGRYSHWGATLYFSASDDSDPNTNGRVYSVRPPHGWSGRMPHPASDVAGACPPEAPPAPAGSAPSAASASVAASAPPAESASAAPAVPEADSASAGPAAGSAPGLAGLPRLGWQVHELCAESLVALGGHAVRCDVPARWPSDADNLSTLLLLEDDLLLPHPHALHADIGAHGMGRYSHWHGSLVFSSSDGSDPAVNGRRYAAVWADALLLGHAPDPPRRQQGHCHVLRTLPRHWVSDGDGATSRLVLLEDGRPLGPPHAPHAEIRELGGGRMSHWRGELWFSTSDNSDPATNGRTYAVLPLV